MPENIPIGVEPTANTTKLERQVSGALARASKSLKLDLGGKGASEIKKISQPLGRITGQADEFTKSIEASNARVIAFGASVGIINAVVQSFKGLVNVTIEVEAQLAKISSILKTTDENFLKLKDNIFEIARTTGQTFDTVSDAALELSRQGLNAEQITTRLNDALILSRLSGISAAEAVAGLTAAVNSFTKEGLTTADVLNKISNAANQFAVSERDLIEGFKRSASVAQQAGVSIDELGGIITAVQQKTARGGAVIGNSFKTIFTRIGRAENLELLKSVGVQIDDLATGEILPATKLIENLAKQLKNLNQVEVRSISERIGGGFQIAPLLAALSDYSEENSIATRATQAFQEATDEAYQKNIILNDTLAAGINLTRVNIEELANALGELGIIDPFKELLAGVNSFVNGLKNVFSAIKGNDIFGPIFTGIFDSLIKIGIAAFGVVLVVLTTKLAKFGIEGFKTFVGLNKEAKLLEATEENILNTLLKDKDVRDEILKINSSNLSEEQKRLTIAQQFTDAIEQQVSTLQSLQKISSKITPDVVQGTRNLNVSTSGSGSSATGFIANAADGFLPIGQEKKDISKKIGGAPVSAKPVVIEDFNFGKGVRGTMVANDSELFVKGFNGGDAIFNQEMIEEFGVPQGAKQLNAAKGYIPNFVGDRSGGDKITAADAVAIAANKAGYSPTKVLTVSDALKTGLFKQVQARTGAAPAYVFTDPESKVQTRFPGSQFANKDGTLKKQGVNARKSFAESGTTAREIQTGKDKNTVKIDAEKLGGIVLVTPRAGKKPTKQSTGQTSTKNISLFNDVFEKKQKKQKLKPEETKATQSFIQLTNVDVTGVPKGQDVEGVNKSIIKYLSGGVAALAGDLYGRKLVDVREAKGRLEALGEGTQLVNATTQGAVFEAASKVALDRLDDFAERFSKDESQAPFDFVDKELLQKAFGVTAIRGEAKRGGEGKDLKGFLSSTQAGTLISKSLKDKATRGPAIEELKKGGIIASSSRGYIPNYEQSALEDAIQRENDAGVPVNQIRINQSGKLRNSQNPLGLAITNTRDEPTGAIPSNASRGFIPNFQIPKKGTRNVLELLEAQRAVPKGQELGNVGKQIANELKETTGALEKFEKEIQQITKDVKDRIISQKQANEAIDKLVDALDGRIKEVRQLDPTVNKPGEKLVSGTGQAGKEFARESARNRVQLEGGTGRVDKKDDDGLNFILLTSGLFTASNALKTFAEKTDSYAANIAEAGAGLADTIILIEGIQRFGLNASSLGRKEEEGFGEFQNRFGEEFAEKLGGRFDRFTRRAAKKAEEIEVPEFNTKDFAEDVGTLQLRKRSSKRLNSFIGGLGKAGKFVTGFGRIFGKLIPLIGPIVTGFSLLNAGLKLIGVDLVGTIKDGIVKLGETFGFLDTPAEKSAKKLEEFSKGLSSGLLAEAPTTGQNVLAQSGRLATIEAKQDEIRRGLKEAGEEDVDKLEAADLAAKQFEQIAKNLSIDSVPVASDLQIDSDAAKIFAETAAANFTKQILNLGTAEQIQSTDLTDQAQVQSLLDEIVKGLPEAARQALSRAQDLTGELVELQTGGGSADEIRKATQERLELVKEIFEIQKREEQAAKAIEKLSADTLKIRLKAIQAENNLLNSIKSRAEFELEIQRISLEGNRNRQIEADLELQNLEANRKARSEINDLIINQITNTKRVQDILEGDQNQEIAATRFEALQTLVAELSKVDLSTGVDFSEIEGPLTKGIDLFVKQSDLAKEIVSRIKEEFKEKQKTLELEEKIRRVTLLRTQVLKDQNNIYKEEQRILQDNLDIQNEITKSRLQAANAKIDKSERSLGRIFGGGEPPSVIDIVKEINAQRKEQNDLLIKRFERLEKIQGEFTNIARDEGVINEPGVRELISSLTENDGQDGSPELIRQVTDRLNEITNTAREARRIELEKNEDLLKRQTSNAEKLTTAINRLVDFLNKEEGKAKDEKERPGFESEAREAALNQERKRFEILDERKKIFDLSQKVPVTPVGERSRQNQSKRAQERLSVLNKEFDELAAKTNIYKKAIAGNISIEEARNQILKLKNPDEDKVKKEFFELSQRVAQSRVALESFDRAIGLFEEGSLPNQQSRDQLTQLLDLGNISSGEVGRENERIFKQLQGGDTNFRGNRFTALERLQEEEIKANKELVKKLEEATAAYNAVRGNNETTGETRQDPINEARSSARPSLLASRQLSQIDTRLREVNDSISSLNQQQGTDGANREEIKAKREKLEAEKKELEARRTAATQLTESTGILKLFNDILKKVKDFFGRFIPGFRTAEEVGQQGEAFPTSRATQEDIARANERTADVSFEDRLEERRLAAYYDYELQLIDTNSTAERRGLERQLELRLEALTITQQIADISSKGIDNLNEEELKQLRLLSLKQEEILKRQPSVKDRIFDEIAVDPKGAVDNVNNTLVKGAKDFTDALVNGIEAAVVEGKDLGDTLRGAATEFLRELTRTNLRNAIGGIASIFSGGPTTFEGSTNPAARGGSPQNAVWTRSADIRIGGSSRSNSGGLGGVGGECSGNGCIFQDPNYGEQSTSNSSSTIGDIFKKIFDGFKNSFSSIFNGLKGILGNIGSSVGGFFGNLFGFEKGGKVTGGSGSKDDVPAMLMGGEFVMNRNSVQKYGPQFMEAVNSGKLQKFATGGIVDPEKIPTQNRTGNYFAPGIRGTGKITGAQALRSFATQGFTVGETDFIGASGAGSSGGAAFIDLEPESIRLTNRGRTAGTPLQLATQDAKQQAFDLALQDERLRAEIKAEEKRQKEEFKRAVISTVASAVISYGVNVGVSGYKNAANAYTAKAGAEATTSGRVWEGLKGVWGGGTLEGGGTQTYGGFANLFNGRGTVTQQNLANYWANNISDPGAQQFFKSGTFLNSQGSYQFVANNPEVKKVIESGGGSNILSRSSAQAAASSQVTANSAILRDEQTRGLAEVAIDKIRSTINAGFDFLSAGSSGFPRNPKIIKSNTNPPQNFTGIVQYPFGRRAYLRGKAIDVDNIDSYATGGSIPNVAGIDTVPAMLSGGEFIVNSAAADRLGQANLERINAGEDPEDQRQNQDDLTEKLDELIKVTKESTGEINITVNGDGSATEEKSGNSEGEEQNVRLARVIRDQVLKVIQDEKRLGGTLRRGL